MVLTDCRKLKAETRKQQVVLEEVVVVVVVEYYTVLHLTSHPSTGLTGCEGQLPGKYKVNCPN